MANAIHKISGVGSASATPIIAGALRPSQKALLSAWKSGALPASAHQFMNLVRAGTQKTGRSRDVNKVTASQIPERLATQLAALTRPEGVQQFAAQLLYTAPQAGQTNLQALANRAVLPAVQAQQINTALGVSVKQGNPISLMQVLSMLPLKVAQSILDERGAAIDAFLKAWTEDIARNAELDAQAAKKAAELAAQAQLTQRHASELARANLALNMKKANQLSGMRKLDATSSAFGKTLLQQRMKVLENTLSLAPSEVQGSSLVEMSLNTTQRAGSFASYMAPILNVATLDALDTPEDDLGPRLGLKRGHQGIQG